MPRQYLSYFIANIFCCAAMLSLSLTGCGAREATDTKTNWLSYCAKDADCGEALHCVCGVCSQECHSDAECAPLGKRAACFEAAECGGISVCAGSSEDLKTAQSSAASTSTAPGIAPASSSNPDITCDPDVKYIAYGTACLTVDFVCAGGAKQVNNDCGCGCKPNPACNPKVQYAAYGDQCGTLDYACVDGTTSVSDECGCGCKPDPACDPNIKYAAYGDQCGLIDFACEPGTVYAGDQCGCGCITDPSCDPDVQYAAYGDKCGSVDFACVDGTTTVSDECGCGCKSTTPAAAAPTTNNNEAACFLPAGTPVKVQVVANTLCPGGVTSAVVRSQAEIDQAMQNCGWREVKAEFANNLVYVSGSSHRNLSFHSAVQAADGIHLLLDQPAYCAELKDGPNWILTLQLNDVSDATPIIEHICYTGACQQPPAP